MTRRSLLQLLLLAAIWGSSFLFIKLALAGLSPAQLVLARLVAGAGTLGAVVAVRGERLPRDATLLAHLIVMAVVSNIFPFFLYAWGEERITSGLAGVLNATVPLFTLGFAALALPQERLTALRAAGLALGFAGVVLLVGPWDTNPLTSSIPGQLACLGAAACYGIGFVYARRFVVPAGASGLGVSAAQIASGAILMGAFAPLVATGPVALTPAVTISALFLGVFATGAAYLLYYGLVADLGATGASMVTYLLPLVAVLLGVAVLGEPLTWNVFAGGGVLILGVAVAEGRVSGLGRAHDDAPSVDAPVTNPSRR